MMLLSLNDIAVGGECQVTAIHASGTLRRRLLDLGFVPGANVSIIRRAPLGDPTAYLIRGALIALRREEAAFIQVK